jgi:hypothetical protein
MKYLIILAIIITLIFIMGGSALALDDPENTSIEDVQVYRHLLQANDTLMWVVYDISYGNLTAVPNVAINKTFYFTYGNTSDTFGNETACPFFNRGYARGFVAFYWENDDPDIPPWGQLGNVTVTGMGAYFALPVPTDTWTLTTSDYTNYTSPSDIREELRQYLIEELGFLELDWNNWYADIGYADRQVDLLQEIPPEYTVLSGSGEAYMHCVWDWSRSAVPNLFMLNVYAPEHTEGNWTLTQQETYESLHVDDYIGNATAALSDLVGGIGQTWAATFVVIIAALAIIITCQVKWQKALIGCLIAYVLILLATPEGLFQMGLMALLAFIAVLQITYTFFWSKSSG